MQQSASADVVSRREATEGGARPAQAAGKDPKPAAGKYSICPNAPPKRTHTPFKIIPYSSHTRHLDPSAAPTDRPKGGNELRKHIMKKQPPRDSQPGSCNTSDPASVSPSPDLFITDHSKPHLKGNAPRKSPLKGGRGRPATITGSPLHPSPYPQGQQPVDATICSMCLRANGVPRQHNSLCDRCNKMYPACRRIGMKHEDVTYFLSLIPNHERLSETALSQQVRDMWRAAGRTRYGTPGTHAQHAFVPGGQTGVKHRAGTMSPHLGKGRRGPHQQMQARPAAGAGSCMSGPPKSLEGRVSRARSFAYSAEITFGRQPQSPSALRSQTPGKVGIGSMVEERCGYNPLVLFLPVSARPVLWRLHHEGYIGCLYLIVLICPLGVPCV